jgi:hypothetical protein
MNMSTVWIWRVGLREDGENSGNNEVTEKAQ